MTKWSEHLDMNTTAKAFFVLGVVALLLAAWMMRYEAVGTGAKCLDRWTGTVNPCNHYD